MKSYRFTIINTYQGFMKDSESEVESELEVLRTNSTALVRRVMFSKIEKDKLHDVPHSGHPVTRGSPEMLLHA
jgi:hypothetical protein